MWIRTTKCIREAAKEVLGLSKGNIGGHREDWWWNREVQRKALDKKGCFHEVTSYHREKMRKRRSQIGRRIRL